MVEDCASERRDVGARGPRGARGAGAGRGASRAGRSGEETCPGEQRPRHSPAGSRSRAMRARDRAPTATAGPGGAGPR